MSPYLYVRISVYARCIFDLSIEILRGLNSTFIVDPRDFPGFCETFRFLINHSTLLYVAQRSPCCLWKFRRHSTGVISNFRHSEIPADLRRFPYQLKLGWHAKDASSDLTAEIKLHKR